MAYYFLKVPVNILIVDGLWVGGGLAQLFDSVPYGH